MLSAGSAYPLFTLPWLWPQGPNFISCSSFSLASAGICCRRHKGWGRMGSECLLCSPFLFPATPAGCLFLEEAFATVLVFTSHCPLQPCSWTIHAHLPSWLLPLWMTHSTLSLCVGFSSPSPHYKDSPFIIFSSMHFQVPSASCQHPDYIVTSNNISDV